MTSSPPSPGRFVGEGKYELLSPIGLGAMGVVYLARHVALDRVVAVKVLNAGLTVNDQAAERFLREARSASLLRHKNTVKVLDFGGDQTSGFFLVMEYIEGKNLSEVMAEEGTLDPARAIAIVNQVLAALAEAHEYEIVHRDIKPANIMLVPWTDDDGRDEEAVKVLDFGLATMRSEPREHMRDEIAGTPEYMSPEQAQGLELDARSDLYAAATTLYAMVCGEVPFAFESALETMLAQISTTPRSPRALAPQLSPELEAVILRGLAKHPDERFANARAFRTALLEVPEVSPTIRIEMAGPPTPMPTPIVPITTEAMVALPRARPRRGLMWAAFVLLLLAAGALVAWQVGLFTPRTATEQVAAAPAPATPPEPLPPEPVAVNAVPVERAPVSPEPRPVAEREEPEPAEPEPVAIQPAPEPVPVAVVQLPKREPRERKKLRDTPVVASVIAPAEPVKPEPVEPEPEPMPVAHVVPEPVEPEPMKPEPAKPEPMKPEPAKPKPVLSANAGIGSLVVDGSLPRSSIARALEALRPALEGCYRTAASSANADATTSTSVRFVIDVDGRTRNVTVGALSLPGLQSCAAAAIARLRTKDRPDTGTVGAAFHLSFTPRVP